MIFDQYDRLRIVNLPRRADRRREMEAELARFGGLAAHSDLAFFPALRPAHQAPFNCVGAHGCYLSHFRILEQALADQASVLILEDDCRFLPGLTQFTQAGDTDIFYGGWQQASNPADMLNSDIIGSHFMGFSRRVLNDLVPFLQKVLDPAARFDPAIVRSDFNPAIRPPIDGAYIWFRRYHPEYKTQFAPLARQRASASDVADRSWFDQVPVVKELAGAARRIRNRLA